MREMPNGVGIGLLPGGAEVERLGTVREDGVTWVRIRFINNLGEEQTGFMQADFLDCP